MSVCHPQQQLVWCIATQNTLFESLGGNSWRRFTLAPRGDLTRNGILKFDKSTAQACDPPHFPRYSSSLHGSSSRLLLAIQGGEQHHSTIVSPPVNEGALEAQVGSVQHQYYSFLFRNLTVTTEERLRITAAIQQGTLLACCDGSYNPNTTTASYYQYPSFSMYVPPKTYPVEPSHCIMTAQKHISSYLIPQGNSRGSYRMIMMLSLKSNIVSKDYRST
jgi:hypothetical protein